MGIAAAALLLGIAYAGLGLGLSALFVRETRAHVHHEAAAHRARDGDHPTTAEVFARTTLREPALSSCSQAGLANNLNDGLAWGLLPVFFAAQGLQVAAIGFLAALYPAFWVPASSALARCRIASVASG